MSNHNYPGDLLLLLGDSNRNLLFPQDPNTVLDLTNPEAWKLLIQPDQQDGDDDDDDTHEAPTTTHADLEIPNVYYHLEQKGQHYVSLLEDVDQFMQSTMIEDDTMNQFKRAATLDTPWCQNVTQTASGPRERQLDAVDWCQHSQSTTCITKTTTTTTTTDYRKVPAPPSRVAAAAPPHASSSFQPTSSSRTAAVPTTTTTTTPTGIITVFSTADRNQLLLPSRQQESAKPGDFDPHDLAMSTNPMNNDPSTTGVAVHSPTDAAATMPPPPQQRPILMCKPLTAYNYFYRIERANIVNGMACATDPIPPVDHNVSLEQREKLLQQRWYVESKKSICGGCSIATRNTH
jgi:hypothetical protein